MGTDRNQLIKGIKYIAICFPLIFLSPFLITIGFKAIKNNNYIFLIVGIVLFIVTIILGFIGIKTIVQSFFNKS